MSFARSCVFPLLFAFLICGSLSAQNLEGGAHAGFGVIGDTTPLGTETSPAYGVWVLIWPNDRFAVAGEWAYLTRDSWQETKDGFVVGETNRNRQHVDLTLQFHLAERSGFRFFAEGGGGKHWNNRTVQNPGGIPQFEESGKESTSFGVWTLGVGVRKKLLPHLNWIAETKLHNPGSETKYGVRFFTGLSVSLR